MNRGDFSVPALTSVSKSCINLRATVREYAGRVVEDWPVTSGRVIESFVRQ